MSRTRKPYADANVRIILDSVPEARDNHLLLIKIYRANHDDSILDDTILRASRRIQRKEENLRGRYWEVRQKCNVVKSVPPGGHEKMGIKAAILSLFGFGR